MDATPSVNADQRQSRSVGKQNRQAKIASAAVDILGRDGSRSLTHRAVDREADLPDGTTSAYYPKRIDLLRAAFRFLLERDFALLDDHFTARVLRQSQVDIDEAATFVDELAQKIMNNPDSGRLARYECYLMAARDSDFSDILSWMFSVRERHWVALFTKLRAPDPRNAAMTFEMLLRGVFHTNSLFHEMKQMTDVRFFRKLIVLSLAP